MYRDQVPGLLVGRSEHHDILWFKGSFRLVRAIFVWPRKMVVICFISQWMKRSKHNLFVFPLKKTLIRRRHCSIGQLCCSMTSKPSIGWFLWSSSGMKFYSTERRSRSRSRNHNRRACDLEKTAFRFRLRPRPIVGVGSRSGRTKSITKRGNVHCDWFILPLLLPTPTIWFSLDHKRNVSDGVVSGVGRNGNDSSDSDSAALMTPLTTRIFYFHALTTPTPIPSLVKTS